MHSPAAETCNCSIGWCTTSTSAAHIMGEGAAIVRGMRAIEVPIVAAVNGPAVGLGCSLAGLSDIVLVEEQAYFADLSRRARPGRRRRRCDDLATADRSAAGEGFTSSSVTGSPHQTPLRSA